MTDAAAALLLAARPDKAISSEELQLRGWIIAWARVRWPDCRVLHELELGERRLDLAFVADKDLIGVEIKSSRDRLDRLQGQLAEFRRYVPEVWLAVAPKWVRKVQHLPNVMVVAGGTVETLAERTAKTRGLRHVPKPQRDELVCSRMLELVWRDEAARIAMRTGVIPGRTPTSQPLHLIRPMLARLLTGNEIMREVCRELRERAGAFGHRSDAPVKGRARVVAAPAEEAVQS